MSRPLYLGDVVDVNPYWPSDYPDTHWFGIVKALGSHNVLVEALERSDDPLVENERQVSYRALRRASVVFNQDADEWREVRASERQRGS